MKRQVFDSLYSFWGAKRVVSSLVVMVLTKLHLHLHLVESQIFQRLHCHVICQFQEQQITLEMFVYCIPNGTSQHFYSSPPQTIIEKRALSLSLSLYLVRRCLVTTHEQTFNLTIGAYQLVHASKHTCTHTHTNAHAQIVVLQNVLIVRTINVVIIIIINAS